MHHNAPDGHERLAEHLATARTLAERFATEGVLHVIDGLVASSDNWLPVESPIDGVQMAMVARGGAAEIDRAVAAASRAFAAWGRVCPDDRRRLLHAIADGIERRATEIALLESLDSGQPLRFTSKSAIRGAENFRFFADRVHGAGDGQSLPTSTHLNFTTRSPIGVVGAITPWNTPFMLSTWKLAPALAAGCTVVHKPAEWSPVTAQLLAEIALDAGLPPGVLNVVHGLGEEAGRALTEHPLVRAIAFVGETSTGAAIQAQGAPTLKRVHFELGGKNAVVVFDDADLERALDAVIFMIFSLNGERCTSSSRLLVHRRVADEFVERLVERVRQLRVGNPLDPATEIGPLIHRKHLAKVVSYFDIGQREGATIAAGGHRLEVPGNFVAPTVFTDVKQGTRIAQEEIFGPVLSVLVFDSEDEAVEIANDVRYGLAGYVWTADVTRALRVAHRLDVGMVWVNSENVRHLPTPFGGAKDSGIGRDGGDYSFEFLMETKNVAIALGNHAIPRLGAA